MPVGIDTSVLVAAEKQGDFEKLLPESEEGPYYIPALAATEFLVGTHPPVRSDLRHRASQRYVNGFRARSSSFIEAEARRPAPARPSRPAAQSLPALREPFSTTGFQFHRSGRHAACGFDCRLESQRQD